MLYWHELQGKLTGFQDRILGPHDYRSASRVHPRVSASLDTMLSASLSLTRGFIHMTFASRTDRGSGRGALEGFLSAASFTGQPRSLPHPVSYTRRRREYLLE